jgi:hypothetical protein
MITMLTITNLFPLPLENRQMQIVEFLDCLSFKFVLLSLTIRHIHGNKLIHFGVSLYLLFMSLPFATSYLCQRYFAFWIGLCASSAALMAFYRAHCVSFNTRNLN